MAQNGFEDALEKDFCLGMVDSGEAPEGDAAPVDPKRRNRVMAACACVIGNETAERLAYCEWVLV